MDPDVLQKIWRTALALPFIWLTNIPPHFNSSAFLCFSRVGHLGKEEEEEAQHQVIAAMSSEDLFDHNPNSVEQIDKPSKSNEDTVKRLIQHRLENQIPSSPPQSVSVSRKRKQTEASEGETEATNEEGEENGDEESSSEEELAESELTQEDCNKKTVNELRAQCKTLGIKSSGRKGDLIQRILKFQ